MTRIVTADAYGDPQVLSEHQVDPPVPGPGEVLVDVQAAGVNPADVKMYSGVWGTDPARLPMRLGLEVAGVVSAVGSDAVGPCGPVRVGDEVLAFPVSGGYAEQVVVAAQNVLARPAELAPSPAAGLLLAGTTAWHTLEATGVRAGETVLVHGVAGAVGLMVAQLARVRGAHVVGTARAEHHTLLRSFGVRPVEYGEGLRERVLEQVAGSPADTTIDAAVDTVGAPQALQVSLDLVADRSRIATIAAFEAGAAAGVRLLGSAPGAQEGHDIRMAARTRLVDLACSGAVRVLVAAEVPMAEVQRAHRLQLSRHAPGKIVLVP